jgi:hypothetical protein
MEHVAPDRIGMASGLLNTARGGANALVLAVFGAALISLMQSEVGGREQARCLLSGLMIHRLVGDTARNVARPAEATVANEG